jgi:hypothetical protein
MKATMTTVVARTVKPKTRLGMKFFFSRSVDQKRQADYTNAAERKNDELKQRSSTIVKSRTNALDREAKCSAALF